MKGVHEEFIDRFIVVAATSTSDVTSYLIQAEKYLNARKYSNVAQIFETMLLSHTIKNSWYLTVREFIDHLKKI